MLMGSWTSSFKIHAKAAMIAAFFSPAFPTIKFFDSKGLAA